MVPCFVEYVVLPGDSNSAPESALNSLNLSQNPTRKVRLDQKFRHKDGIILNTSLKKHK